MKRIHNRTMRHNAEMSPVAPHCAEYHGRHEKIAEIITELSELFAEVAEDLELTAEFIAETVAENTARMRTIAEKYLRHLRLPCPEFRPARNLFPSGMEVSFADIGGCRA